MKRIQQIFLLSIPLLLIGIILPFIVLSFYTVPNLEDYAESIIPNVWWHVKFLYLTYDGRYFTSFLFAAANPLKIKSFFLYQCIPVALMVSLFFAFNIFIKTFIFSHKKKALLISGVILSLFLHRNPNLAYSFYYMISSYVYMVPSILFLVYISVSYRLLNQETPNFTLLILSCVLLFCIAGGNELYLIPLVFWLVILYLKNYKQNLNKKAELFALTTTLICSFFIVFTSPGIHNFVEENQTPIDLAYIIHASSMSISFTASQLVKWCSGNFTLLFASIFLAWYFKSIDLNRIWNSSLKKTIVLFLVSGALGLFIILPYTFAAGSKVSYQYTQIYIIPYLYYTIIWVVLLANVSKYLPNIKNKGIFTLGLVLLGGVSLYFDQNNKIKLAYQELLNGKAKTYHTEVKEHISRSLQSPKSIKICLLKNKPESIFSGVYFNTENEDFQMAYRTFYNIDDIIIKECP